MHKLSDGRRPISTERAGAAGPTRSRQRGTNGAAVQGIETRGRPRRRRPLFLSGSSVDHRPGTRDPAMLKGQSIKRLGKKVKRGFRGYPVATVAFYGPDRTRASKVAVVKRLEDRVPWRHEEVA